MNRSSRLLQALLTVVLGVVAAGCTAGTPIELATLHIDPTPTPTPTPPTPGELAARAFFARVASGKLTYRRRRRQRSPAVRDMAA